MEVQLRTIGQHRWAEAVERSASRTGFDLKDGKGPDDLVDYFRVASDVISAQEREGELDEELMERFEQLRGRALPYFRKARRRSRGSD